MNKINPFQPNSPVNEGMFVGRIEEVLELEKGLHQTKNGYSSNYLVTGERGIGKSSLLMFLKHVSTGCYDSLKQGKFNFVTVNIVVSDKTDLGTFIKRIEKALSREIGKIETGRKFFKEMWGFVQRIKIMDSGIDQASRESDNDILIDDFSYSLAETVRRITNPEQKEVSKDGIVFLIDEADSACAELRIGYFLKAVTEQLQQHSCNNVMFVLAGLPDVVEKLSSSHESSVRIFKQLKIRELVPEDRKRVVDKGISKGNEINTEQTAITDKAKSQISILSEGYPHFIQQFSYSAFDHNTDDEITDDDVVEAAFKQGGALDAIGNQYYKSYFHDQIKSDEYREVLSIMAEEMNSWIKKSDINAKFSGDESTLTNALRALTSRKIILKNPSKMGEYRLQQRGFALWIKLFGERKK